MVKQVVVAGDGTHIAADLEFVPLDYGISFGFVDGGVEEFGLSSFRVSVLFPLPGGTDALIDKVS